MDVSCLLSSVLGCIAGGLITFLTAWWFYKKSNRGERIIRDILESNHKVMIADKLGIDVAFDEKPTEPLPQNKDIPHIVRFWRSKKSLEQNEPAVALFRVRDEGLNFFGKIDLSDITDTSGNVKFKTKREGYGFYSCELDFSKSNVVGNHCIQIKLSDKNNNTFTHKINFEIGKLVS